MDALQKWIPAIMVAALLVPAAWAAYSIDPNKVGIVGGTQVGSGSYNMIVATEQETIGEISSSSYVTQLGWLYTIEDTPTVSDANVAPSTWVGTGTVTLGFKCSDPNGITDFNRAHAAIYGANTADLNNISYTVDGQAAIIAVDISNYLTTKGTYYVMPFCVDDENNVGKGSTVTGQYITGVTISVGLEQDTNINSNPTIYFDVNSYSSSDANLSSITVDLNGTASNDFNAEADCTAFDGNYHCSYTETDLTQDEDNNISFNAADESGNPATQVERIVHFDATAPVVSSVSATGSGSNVLVSWSGQDSFTGIETYYVREGSSEWIDAGLDTSYTFSGHSNADHAYSVKARDYADNNSLIVQAAYTAPSEPGPSPGPGGGPGGGGSGVPPAEPPIPGVKEGFFDLNIVRIDDPVEAGERVDFTYKVWNNTRENGSAYIEYWLEKNGKKDASGSETIYLNSRETRQIDGYLFHVEGMQGKYAFHITLSRPGQENVEKKRETRIMEGAPTRIDLDLSNLEPGDASEPVAFNIEIGSNRDETLPITIREKIYKDGELIWEKKQTVPISVFESFAEEVHGLEEGEYRVEIEAEFEGEKKTATSWFEKKPEKKPEPKFPWHLIILAIGLACAAGIGIMLWRRKEKSGLELWK